MRRDRKKPKSDLRKFYTIFLEAGLIVVLIIFIAAMKIDLRTKQQEVDLTQEQEVVEMQEIERTEQVEKPPPPPKPVVPVEVPNDEVIEDQSYDISSDLNLDEPLDLPPPPPKQEQTQEQEDNFFIAVEDPPKLKGGLSELQSCVNYPEAARKAGIEGRVIVQFIVNEQGNVEDPKVIRGIGGGADEEALRCVRQAQFTPGRQRGTAVRVQYSVPVVFRLQN